MASFKKFWFVTNWVNKKTSPSQPDSIESINSSTTQLSDAILLPICTKSERRVKPRYTAKTRSAIRVPAKRKFRTDLRKTKTSSPSLASTRYAASSSVLQKSTNRRKKAKADDAEETDDSEQTAEKNAELTNGEEPPKSRDPKVKGAKKKAKTTEAVPTEIEVPVKVSVEDINEKNAGVDVPLEKEAAGTPASGGNNTAAGGSQAVGEAEKPETAGVLSEDGESQASKSETSDENQPRDRQATDKEEPVTGEEGSVGRRRRKRRRDGSAGAETPVVGEEAEPTTFGPRRQRRLRETTTTTSTETPTSAFSSTSRPRHSGPRKPFSKPLTFSTRSSQFDSLNDIERSHSISHEQYLQKAWTLMNAPYLKMLKTPSKIPDYLKEPPELGSVGTLTSELRRSHTMRKIEARRKSSLELIKNPFMLVMMQSKTNRCEILRKKYAKKEPIISAFFEQHFDQFQRPPFRNVRPMRKCT